MSLGIKLKSLNILLFSHPFVVKNCETESSGCSFLYNESEWQLGLSSYKNEK